MSSADTSVPALAVQRHGQLDKLPVPVRAATLIYNTQTADIYRSVGSRAVCAANLAARSRISGLAT